MVTNLTDDSTILSPANLNARNHGALDGAVEDIEDNQSDDCSQNRKKQCDENDSGEDDFDSAKDIVLVDPHQKHTLKDGKACFIMGCLDCMVGKAAKEIKEDPNWTFIPAEWLDDYLERFMFQENRGKPFGETAQMSMDREVAKRYEEKRRRKEERAARKKKRRKRRKAIERLIRLEGELNGSMGTYAMAFDTQSEPVS